MSRPAEGKVIDGRYRCVRRLGSGGMADVWLCRDTQLDREVALKVLHEQYARDAEFIERFRREAAAMAGLQHPNVVAIFDRGEFEGTYYIAMEYVEGPTLRELINGGLSVAESVEITGQLLAGAQFAHARGVIHRDLKPGNVLVDREGRARIADFGIAQAGASEITQTGSVMGTAEYLAPEQAQGRPVSAASDLYSIGVILYEMLTGQAPFEGDNAVAVAMKHVTERALAPSARNANVSGAIDQVTLKALAKEPANRYQSADEFQAALSAAASTRVAPRDTQVHAPIVAVPPPTATGEHALPPLPPRRWPWVLAAVIAVAVALIVFAFASNPEQVPVPAVSAGNITEERAIRILRGSGFEVASQEVERSEAAGTVVEQDPAAGTDADQGSTVTIFVSVGPGEETIPSVVGLPEADATSALRQAGFKVKVKERFSRDAKAGIAYATSPPPNTSLERGSTVKLFISRGIPRVAVPLVVGKDQAAAVETLKAVGFIVDVEIVTADEPSGTVVDQDPLDGTIRPRRSKVQISVSNGRGTVIAPDVVGLREKRATRTLQKAGLEVTVVYEEVTDPSEGGFVRAQNPGGSARVRDGSTVTITVGDYEPPVVPDPEPAP